MTTALPTIGSSVRLTARTRYAANTLRNQGDSWVVVRIDKPVCFDRDESMLLSDRADLSDQRGFLQWVRVTGDRDFEWEAIG